MIEYYYYTLTSYLQKSFKNKSLRRRVAARNEQSGLVSI